MVWTAPRTWTTGELVTAALQNTHIRDNELYLGQFISGTRKLPMPILQSPSQDQPPTGTAYFPDTVPRRLQSFIPIPADWESGTDLTLVLTVRKAGAAIEQAIMFSWIAAQSDTETFAWNIENNATITQNIPASNEIERITRTITAAGVSADERIMWLVERQANSGADTLDEDLYVEGVWLEYTPLF